MSWIDADCFLPQKGEAKYGFGGMYARVLVSVNGYGTAIDRFNYKEKKFQKYHGYVTHWDYLKPPVMSLE